MSTPAMPVELALKPDMPEATRRWLAFWEHELIERPCCVIRAPKAGRPRATAPPYMAGAHGDLPAVAEQALAWASSLYWGGEAIPSYTPSFGPDMVACFLGAALEFSDDAIRTSWAQPCIDDWEESLPIALNGENYWWQRMLEFCRVLRRTFAGQMLVTHLDLHSNLDALLAMRGGERLCLDMIDRPETIDRAMRQVRPLYRPIYEQVYEAAGMAATGTCGWVHAYHPVRTNTIQCDFAALIGPKHFRRWARPALEEEARLLGHCVYHLDGPECLVHLDELCAIEGLDCIQWVPGAGEKPFIEWIDLLQCIQAKGVSVWVPCTCETIKVFHKALRPELVLYDCWAPDEGAAEATLSWLAAHM